VTEAFALILDIAERRGVRDIGTLPGCWEFTAGPWSIAVNGSRDERTTAAGDKVPPFHALAVNNDLLVGVALISPRNGVCAEGVEDDLCAALREELNRV
jgi:hypothetical protein